MDKAFEVAEKILGVLGYDFYQAYIKVYFDAHKKRIDYKIENELAIKKSISESKALTLEQKVSLNAIIGKNLKSIKNQMDILCITIDNLDEDADINNLNEDWILDFFNKASLISEEDTKRVWGKLLACAASDRSICSKLLLNALFLMGSEEMSDFLNVCQYCFSEMNTKSSEERISSYPIIFYSKHVDTYNRQRISSMRLQKLQILGLVETNYKDEYIFTEKKVKLIYKDKVLEIESDKKIRIGNVRFTYEGFLLYKMSEKIFNTGIFNFTIEIWKRRKCAVYLNGNIV